MQRNNKITQQYLMEAGIEKGMRVLELGYGNGEVTAILAELVGTEGAIVALDQHSKSVAKVKSDLDKNGYQNISFIEHDLNSDGLTLSKSLGQSFDAIVCRRVLMYLTSPSKAIASIAGLLKPSGLFFAEETDLKMVPASSDDLPAHNLASEWIRNMLIIEDAHLSMGFDMPKVFSAAGFKVNGLRAQAVIEGQGMQYSLADLVSMLETRLVDGQIASSKEIAILVAQLEQETIKANFVYVSGMSFYAWAERL